MIQRHELTAAEMDDRLARNRDRLLKPYYQMPEVFQSPDADWPGDKEGRALLAFVSHYKATGYSNPCMEQMLEALPAHTNAQLYFGPDACEEISSSSCPDTRGCCAVCASITSNSATPSRAGHWNP